MELQEVIDALDVHIASLAATDQQLSDANVAARISVAILVATLHLSGSVDARPYIEALRQWTSNSDEIKRVLNDLAQAIEEMIDGRTPPSLSIIPGGKA